MELTGNTFFFQWEVDLIIWLQAHMGSFGTSLASFISAFGEELACVVVLGFIYWCYDKRFGRFVGMNALFALVLNPMIKCAVLRRRPYFDTPEIKCLKPIKKDADIFNIAAQEYSFPSGHSTNAVTVYGSIALYKRENKALTVIAVLLALLIGVSRFCLGVHYPTDVLCGWLLGLAVILFVPWLQKKLNNDRMLYAMMLLVTLPGFFYCRSHDFFEGYGMLLGFALAMEFEQKYVNFENTRGVLRCILRVVGGVAVFFGLNTLLKMPFSQDFLNSAEMASLLVRTVRYTLVVFAVLGVSPMLFKYTAKWFEKPEENKAEKTDEKPAEKPEQAKKEP